MFSLKVDWKKRLIIGLINIIPMITISVLFLIVCFKNNIIDGATVTFVSLFVYILGIKDILFFEKNKKRNLGYIGGKKEDKWIPNGVSTMMRCTGFFILTFYFLLVFFTRIKG